MILYKKVGKRYQPIPTAEVISIALARLSAEPKLRDNVSNIQTAFMFGEVVISKVEGLVDGRAVDG